MVLILIKSIVLSLFLAFITPSNLYYPHHPASEGCTVCIKKKAFYTFSFCTYSCVWFFHLGCSSIAFTLEVKSCASGNALFSNLRTYFLSHSFFLIFVVPSVIILFPHLRSAAGASFAPFSASLLEPLWGDCFHVLLWFLTYPVLYLIPHKLL